MKQKRHIFRRAFQRLFLILLPVSLLFVALFFVHKKFHLLSKTELSFPQDKKGMAGFSNPQCPFYLGLSFFPLEEKKKSFFKGEIKSLWMSDVLSEQDFTQKLEDFKKYFKKKGVSLKKILFVFPLALTKDNQWLVSKKTFFILPTGERKELSHLLYSEIEELHKGFLKQKRYTPLKLESLFSYLPNKNFLFYLESSNREKVIKNMDKNFKAKTQWEIYFSSSNEKLLREILDLSPDWQVLHSFKTLLRFQMMSIFKPAVFKNLPGRGLIIPTALVPPARLLLSLQNQEKLIFFEKDPPYDPTSQALIQKTQALISSQAKQVLSIVQSKKPCFMKN